MPVRVFTKEEKEELRSKMLEAGFPLLKEYGMTHTANLTKLLAITAESKAQLHEVAYSETLDVIVEKILDLIFEEGE